MKAAKDSFSIDILLRHVSHGPEIISEALSLKPRGFWPIGEDLGRVHAKWSFFYARLLDGVSSSDYGRALKNVSRFLQKNTAFLADFKDGHGEVELILNQTVSPQSEEGDESFELHLSPDFLRDLSARDISLRVQGWQGSVKKGSRKKVRGAVGKQ
jgi:hypothetical protein